MTAFRAHHHHQEAEEPKSLQKKADNEDRPTPEFFPPRNVLLPIESKEGAKNQFFILQLLPNITIRSRAPESWRAKAWSKSNDRGWEHAPLRLDAAGSGFALGDLSGRPRPSSATG
jgi:hypothetical protein